MIARRTSGGDGIRAARSCLLLFLLAVVTSFAYIVTTGTYNGDFYGVPERLGVVQQFAIFLTSLLPYAMVWWMYRAFKARQAPGSISVPERRVTLVYFILVFWFIVLAVKYDVGVLGKALYEAPAAITPLIQITNRINPYYLGMLFILIHRGSRKVLYLGIASLIALGVLRAGLGVFIYIALALMVRNHQQIATYFKRHRWKIALIACLFPVFVSQMYSLRSVLRDTESLEIAMSVTEIVTAKLMGRLSSLSNTAMVMQESAYFQRESQWLDPFYFQRQATGGFLGVGVVPEYIPERMLININGGNFFDVSYMVGLPGNVYIAFLISPWLAMLNVVTVILMCAATFYFARKLRFANANEFALLLLLYPLTSGVSTEFSVVLAAVISFCVLFFFLSLRFYGRQRTSEALPPLQSAAAASE